MLDFRCEMFVVGLHRQVQGLIAWIEDQCDKVACSVVVLGDYRDDDLLELGDATQLQTSHSRNRTYSVILHLEHLLNFDSQMMFLVHSCTSSFASQVD
jgi:hypothetical protein